MNKATSLSAIALTIVLLLSLEKLQARYLNVGTGRFQTMDTYEGNNQDPLSLHKYLCTQANPVNMVDPNGNISVKSLTPGKPATTTGSYTLDWQFTLDKKTPEDGFIVQEIPIYQDLVDGPFRKHYWEAWFVPANTDGPVEDHWHLDSSKALTGTGNTHSKIKFYFKRTTGDLGDYRTPPAKPDPKTGWKPGDGVHWSIDLPWTDDPNYLSWNNVNWWSNPSDNGETEASINLDTAWTSKVTGRFVDIESDTISVTLDGVGL